MFDYILRDFGFVPWCVPLPWDAQGILLRLELPEYISVTVGKDRHEYGTARERDRLRRYWYGDVFYPEPEGWDRLARVPSGFPLLVRRLPISQSWWRRLFDRGPHLGMSRLVIMSCDRATCTEDGGGAPVSPVQ